MRLAAFLMFATCYLAGVAVCHAPADTTLFRGLLVLLALVGLPAFAYAFTQEDSHG